MAFDPLNPPEARAEGDLEARLEQAEADLRELRAALDRLEALAADLAAQTANLRNS